MYSIRNYGEMILDEPRMQAYARALRGAITPGCVVADIGAGTGIFALLACRYGARRVYAIEPGDAIAIARDIAQANGFSDRIVFVQAASTDVTLEERADVIVSDLRGILPLFQRHIVAIADARERLLEPGGTLIPQQDSLWCALVDAPEAHARITAPWLENAFDLNMAAAARVLANAFYRIAPSAAGLASDAHRLAVIDYRNIREPNFRANAALVAHRDASVHGLCAWFDSILAPGVELSNAPASAPLIYGNAFFPWPEAVAMRKGDEAHVDVRADLVGPDYVWTWSTRIVRGTSLVARFDQSEFFGEWLPPDALAHRAASYVPGLGEEGRIQRVVLEHMANGSALTDIAADLAARFPKRFPRWEEALAHAGEMSVRFGR